MTSISSCSKCSALVGDKSSRIEMISNPEDHFSYAFIIWNLEIKGLTTITSKSRA